MALRLVIPALTALALTAFALFSFARGAETAPTGIVVSEAWARATPPGAAVAAAYLRIENHGGAEDRVVSITSPAAGMLMLHQTVEENGVSKMREGDTVIPAGGMIEMKPGGSHLMLMDLAAPLKAGDTLDLTLTFEKAGPIEVHAPIAPIGAAAPP